MTNAPRPTLLPDHGDAGLPIAAEPGAALPSPGPKPAASPNAGRDDYSSSIRFTALAAGEPYLMIRGHDVLGPKVARYYAACAHRLQAPPAAVESMLQLADKLDAWTPKKLVDAEHLTDGQQKQLAHQLSMRAFRAGIEVPDTETVFAEERARAALFKRLAPALRLLLEGGEWIDGRFVYDPAAQHRGPQVEPHPCPITGLQRFLYSVGRVLPKEETDHA